MNCVSTVVCGNITLTVVFYKQAQEKYAGSDPDMILASGLQLDLVDGWAWHVLHPYSARAGKKISTVFLTLCTVALISLTHLDPLEHGVETTLAMRIFISFYWQKSSRCLLKALDADRYSTTTANDPQHAYLICVHALNICAHATFACAYNEDNL